MTDPIKFAGRAHLENKIRAQRREIASNQAALRQRNAVLRAWYEGREAILRQMLSQERAAVANLTKRLEGLTRPPE